MKSLFAVVFAASLSAVPFSFAADATQRDAHHPDTPAAKPSSNKAVTSKAESAKMMQMDTQMKAMHEMHEKMMSAKTPEARQKLMAEHMKTMQDGMSAMNGMMGGKAGAMPPMSPQMMQKRMDMMQGMMQMMMDRMEAPAAAR